MKELKIKKTPGKSSAAASKTPAIVRGQKWQLPRGHAEVIHVGKTLVQYRFFKTGVPRGALEMKSIPNFAEAMRTHKAKLIP